MSKRKNRTRGPVERSPTEDRRAASQSVIRNPQSEISPAWLAFGLLAALAIYFAHCAYFWSYVNDDAYITFRYSRFLAMGRGPYFNVGEHVEGYTNFLLMLMMTPVIALFGEMPAAPVAKVVGILSGALAMISIALLVHRAARGNQTTPHQSTVAAILAAALVAVSPSYALNSTSGLETTFFAGCLSLGLLLGSLSLDKGQWRGAGIAFACAALTRPEGILFFAIYWFAQLILSRNAAPPSFRIRLRPLLIDAAIVGGAFTAHLAFRLIAYDGEWLPNTYYAKAGGFWKVAAASYIGHGALRPFFDRFGIGVGIALVGWLFSGATRRQTFPLFCIAAAGALLPFVTGTDWMLGWRLLVPFLPPLAGIVAVGWCRIASLLVRKPSWLGPPLVLICVPLLWYIRGDDRAFFHDYIQTRARGYQTGHTALADWLRSGAAKKGDTIALMDIGIVGYLCIDQNILDVTGLTDRKIAKSQGGFMDKEYEPGYVLDREPEFIVLVFGADGDPNVPVPKGTRLKPWSKNENRIWNDPKFRAAYVRPRPFPARAAHWTDNIAPQIGAERVFEHAHPGKYYLLAAFRRSETSVATQAAPPR